MLTHGRLLELLTYNPVTGHFHWRVSRKNVAAGSRAGFADHKYRRISIDRKQYYEHRLAWFYIHGSWPSDKIDHRNPAFSDNRAANLRCATQTQNLINARRRSDNTSGYKGVSFFKPVKLWRARIYINKKEVSLGYFKTAHEAHLAYTAAAKLHYGAYARP